MSKEDIAREIDLLAEQYSQKMKMPGFRQGKVPVDVVKKVHKQALREEVIQQAVSKLAFARIEKDKIAIAGEPYVEKMDDRGRRGFPGRHRRRNPARDRASRPGEPAGRDSGRRPERAKPSTKPSRSIRSWKPTKDRCRSRTAPSPKTTWCCCWCSPRTRPARENGRARKPIS